MHRCMGLSGFQSWVLVYIGIYPSRMGGGGGGGGGGLCCVEGVVQYDTMAEKYRQAITQAQLLLVCNNYYIMIANISFLH